MWLMDQAPLPWREQYGRLYDLSGLRVHVRARETTIDGNGKSQSGESP